jgi:hypothetical protein
MKKRIITTILASTFIATSCLIQAKLVNGFSDITAKNPRQKSARIAASDSRIAEEMGSPITQKSFMNFMELTKNYIQNLTTHKTANTNNVQVAVKAVIDLVRASKRLQPQDLSNDIKNEIAQIKVNINKLNLPAQLQQMLNSMAQ